ncbi:hypothetical protein ACN2EN_04985 [Aliarcobacter lanthieri]|uniref:hypothetical protein n=1 Tax=Aliarcobacter lanthieri TaxID=1355374 RepID=UPI003AFA7964
MKKIFLLFLPVIFLYANSIEKEVISSDTIVITPTKSKDPFEFIPKGYVLYDKLVGDLNKDGLEDIVLIIKGTDENNMIEVDHVGVVDRNRRGIIIALNKKDYYEIVISNYDCFSSENEDGGVYFPPDLCIYIDKGNLFIDYGHGRYGYWSYIFRYKNSNFELIGYDSSYNNGPIVNEITSVNFLTRKLKSLKNINKDEDKYAEEIFKESWKNIKKERLKKLSEIADFDSLIVNLYTIVE